MPGLFFFFLGVGDAAVINIDTNAFPYGIDIVVVGQTVDQINN